MQCSSQTTCDNAATAITTCSTNTDCQSYQNTNMGTTECCSIYGTMMCSSLASCSEASSATTAMIILIVCVSFCALACIVTGVCGYCNPGAGPICAGQTMAAASRRTVLGYTMTVTHLAFTSGLISSDSTLMGCVSYGQRRYYTVQTTSMDDAQVLVRLSSVVGGLYATSSGVGPPNETNFELAALPPLKELTLSPCDVAAATTWLAPHASI